MNVPLFHIDLVRIFSADRQVYRAFGHIVAASAGSLLLIPQHMVDGHGICEVIDKCPVPPEEVYAVLEYPAGDAVITLSESDESHEAVQLLQCLGIDPNACRLDHISPMVNGEEKVLRLVHPDGIRYAVVMA